MKTWAVLFGVEAAVDAFFWSMGRVLRSCVSVSRQLQVAFCADVALCVYDAALPQAKKAADGRLLLQ